MIRWPARCERCNAVKAERSESQPIDKQIDRPHRIVLAHILIQHRGKQRALLAIRPLNKPLHPIPRKNRGESYRENHPRQSVFTQPGPSRDMRSSQAILDTLSLSATVAITSSSQFNTAIEFEFDIDAAADRNDRPSRQCGAGQFSLHIGVTNRLLDLS
jgi:hypothetical protein